MELNSKEFNKKYKIGTEFYYYAILGKEDTKVKVKTRSRAWEAGSGTPIVKVHGLTGGISIKHLKEVTIVG